MVQWFSTYSPHANANENANIANFILALPININQYL